MLLSQKNKVYILLASIILIISGQLLLTVLANALLPIIEMFVGEVLFVVGFSSIAGNRMPCIIFLYITDSLIFLHQVYLQGSPIPIGTKTYSILGFVNRYVNYTSYVFTNFFIISCMLLFAFLIIVLTYNHSKNIK